MIKKPFYSCGKSTFCKVMAGMVISSVLFTNFPSAEINSATRNEELNSLSTFDASKNNMLNEINKNNTVINDYGDVLCINDEVTAKKVNSKNEPVGPSDKASDSESEESIRSVQAYYTIKDLNKLSYTDLIDVLKSIDFNQIYKTIENPYSFNDDTFEFFNDDARMDELIKAIEESGKTFTATDDKGISTLIEVVRAAYFLGFYNNDLEKYTTAQYKEKLKPSLQAMASNPNLNIGEEKQTYVLQGFGLLSQYYTDPEIITAAANIMKGYNDNIESYLGNLSYEIAIYNLIIGPSYDLYLYGFHNNWSFQGTKWENKCDTYINEMGRLALHGQVNSNTESLINNSLFKIAQVGRVHTNPREGLRVITEGLTLYEYLGYQYFQCMSSIDWEYKDIDYNGNNINYEDAKEAGKQKYLSKTYTFDDETIVVKAGDKVAEEKIKRLYWAAKEVKAQFHRVVGDDEPLEVGNADDILTIVIYNSPNEYTMNKMLYALDTNNGGIYIEGTGTFFTYERTPQDSIYTLEELFRHEYTHYLQSRYIVPGLWGQAEIYRNGRLTWFEEGGAELFAGSTRTDGILPRASMVSNIAWTDPVYRYSLKDTMYANYQSGQFDFYRYAYVLQHYIYENEMQIMDDFITTLQNDDVKKYDYIREIYANDTNLSLNYDSHMQDLVDKYNANELTIPLVSDDYLINHEYKNQNEIYSDIASVLGLKQVTTNINRSQFFRSFTLEGTYNAGPSKGQKVDKEEMSNKLDAGLKTLSEKTWRGYDTLTGYMTDYKVENGNVIWNVTIHGVLPGQIDNNEGIGSETEANNTFDKANGPVVTSKSVYGSLDVNDIDIFYFDVTSKGVIDINVETNGLSNSTWILYSENNLDEPVAYMSKKDGLNLSGAYNAKPGRYFVKLYSVGGAKDDYQLTIKGNLNGETVEQKPLIKEVEDNNSFDMANLMAINSRLDAELGGKDSKDIFCFNVDSEKEINISTNAANGLGMSWKVYHESDLNNYIEYPKNVVGQNASTTFTAKPGKYYIEVYNYSGQGTYQLSVK